MKLCISLSARPSNIGTRFHNYLYEELGLNFIYKAFSTQDIDGAIQGVRALGIRGCAISMPFKEAVIPLIDEMQSSASAIESVNTIVNDEGVLRGYNTDFQAVVDVLTAHQVNPNSSVLVRGSGGMAKAVVAALQSLNFSDVVVTSRNELTGRALATKYGYFWLAEELINVSESKDVLINVTPIGMTGENQSELAFDTQLISNSKVVFDVIAFPIETPLIVKSRALGKSVITGIEVMSLQAALQFELYTGIALTSDQVRRASEFSREESK